MHTIAAWINDTMAPNMEAIIIKTMPPPNRMAHRAKAATKICANSFICLFTPRIKNGFNHHKIKKGAEDD